MSVPPLPFLSSLPSIPLLVSGRSDPGAGRPPQLSVGEVVRAVVLDARGPGPAILSVKDRPLGAHSNYPLRQGETVTLLVQKLQPQILFRLLGGTESRTLLLESHISQHRLFPRSLLNIFTDAEAILRGNGLNSLVRSLGKTDADMLVSFLRALVVTRDSLDRGFLFRDYLERFGFLMENQLARALKQKWGQARAARNAGENLKAFLLSAEAKLTASGEKAPELLRFVSSSIKSIETCQIVNSVLREQEQSLILQVPLSLADRIDLVDVVIRFDDEREGPAEKKERPVTVHFFFDMDSLGPLAVEAGMVSGRIGCIITCENPAAALFMEPFMNELQSNLEAAGLAVDGISCSAGPARRIADEIRESLTPLSTGDVVDVKA